MTATKTAEVVEPTTWDKAFLAAQKDFPAIGLDAEGSTGGRDYLYASLPSLLKTFLPILHDHGLYLTQVFDNEGRLVTIIAHEVGEQRSSYTLMPSMGQMKPQDFGKTVTYARRYALVAMLGIAPDEDTDAAGVDAPEPRTSAPTTENPTPDVQTGKFRAAVADLVARGAAAIERVENVNPKLALDEMQSKKTTVLGHEGYERVDEITHRPAQLEFYTALEATVKALEAKASGE